MHFLSLSISSSLSAFFIYQTWWLCQSAYLSSCLSFFQLVCLLISLWCQLHCHPSIFLAAIAMPELDAICSGWYSTYPTSLPTYCRCGGLLIIWSRSMAQLFFNSSTLDIVFIARFTGVSGTLRWGMVQGWRICDAWAREEDAQPWRKVKEARGRKANPFSNICSLGSICRENMKEGCVSNSRPLWLLLVFFCWTPPSLPQLSSWPHLAWTMNFELFIHLFVHVKLSPKVHISWWGLCFMRVYTSIICPMRCTLTS